MRKIFVTGIGTDVGKTIVSAVLVEALKADYWKPVQAGTLPPTDSDNLKRYISNTVSVIYPETYRLREAKSPHAAAAEEGIRIDPDKIVLPASTNKTLVIEGAGGVMVPLNDRYFVVDLIKKFDAEAIVVVRNYLGSINHSLLTIDALKQQGVKITGLVFNGMPQKASEDIILSYSKLPLIGRIGQENDVDKNTILKYKKDFENI